MDAPVGVAHNVYVPVRGKYGGVSVTLLCQSPASRERTWVDCCTTPVHPTLVVGTNPNATVALPTALVGPANLNNTDTAPRTIAFGGWWSSAIDVMVGGDALSTVWSLSTRNEKGWGGK